MARIQQSIEIRVPVHAAYNQLTQFEEYPRFMEDVSAVQQLDDTHLHWTTSMSNRPVEWDAEIIEQEADRCIAWRNTSGPTNTGKVEVQPAGTDASRVIFTLESKPEQVPGSAAGDSEEEMARRLKMDLARLKEFMESRGAETGAWRGEGHGTQFTLPNAGTGNTTGYGAGSEGFAGDEESAAPVTSVSKTAAELRNDSAGSTVPGRLLETAGELSPPGTRPQRNIDTSQEQQAAPSGIAHTAAPDASQQEQDAQAGGQAKAAGGRAAVVGAAGGTDASAGAAMSGNKGPQSGHIPREKDASGMPASTGGSEAAGAAAAGGTSLGGADVGADAGDTRSVPREGTAGTTTGSTGTDVSGRP